jgi:hypothetical protein
VGRAGRRSKVDECHPSRGIVGVGTFAASPPDFFGRYRSPSAGPGRTLMNQTPDKETHMSTDRIIVCAEPAMRWFAFLTWTSRVAVGPNLAWIRLVTASGRKKKSQSKPDAPKDYRGALEGVHARRPSSRRILQGHAAETSYCRWRLGGPWNLGYVRRRGIPGFTDCTEDL